MGHERIEVAIETKPIWNDLVLLHLGPEGAGEAEVGLGSEEKKEKTLRGNLGRRLGNQGE